MKVSQISKLEPVKNSEEVDVQDKMPVILIPHYVGGPCASDSFEYCCGCCGTELSIGHNNTWHPSSVTEERLFLKDKTIDVKCKFAGKYFPPIIFTYLTPNTK